MAKMDEGIIKDCRDVWGCRDGCINNLNWMTGLGKRRDCGDRLDRCINQKEDETRMSTYHIVENFGNIWVSCFLDNSAGYSAEMKEGLGFLKFFYGKVS